MSTARRTATNEQITTYGTSGAGRDYTAFNTWESATDTDHVSLAESDVLECYDDTSSFNDFIFVHTAGTVNSTYFRIIRSASGQGHDGTPNNGFYVNKTTPGIAFSIHEDYFQVQDIICTVTGSSGASIRAFYIGGGTSPAFIGCIAFNCSNTGASDVRGIENHAGTTGLVILCLSHNNENYGYRTGVAAHVYNTVVTNCTGGFTNHGGGTGAVLINCLGSDNGTDFAATWDGGSDYNASKDTTAPGTNSRTEQTFTFVNAAGDDFHLDNSDAGAKEFGTDLSGDGTFAFDDDIDGDLFDTWDIGFDEPNPAGGGANIVPLLIQQQRMRA